MLIRNVEVFSKKPLAIADSALGYTEKLKSKFYIQRFTPSMIDERKKVIFVGCGLPA
jgi:hypothetical protein